MYFGHLKPAPAVARKCLAAPLQLAIRPPLAYKAGVRMDNSQEVGSNWCPKQHLVGFFVVNIKDIEGVGKQIMLLATNVYFKTLEMCEAAAYRSRSFRSHISASCSSKWSILPSLRLQAACFCPGRRPHPKAFQALQVTNWTILCREENQDDHQCRTKCWTNK